MNRRKLIAAAGALPFAAATPAFAQSMPELKWRLTSSFPKSLDTVFTAATTIAGRVGELTGGKFKIDVFAAGEIVPGLAVLESVGKGTVEMGHSAGFYYLGQDTSLIFDTGVPFGLTPRQHNAWYYFGGGEKQMGDIYTGFGVKSIPCGNTGAQMAGWFRKEIKTPEDFKGLKMRVAGFAGRVYAKLGVVPQQIPGGDIYPAMERGTLDAVEWVGPYDDEKLGFQKVAKFYYAPGVIELGAATTLYINLKAWNDLPPQYQAALRAACREAEIEMLASYDAKNAKAIRSLVGQGVKLAYYTPQIVNALRKANDEALAEESEKNSRFKTIYESWRAFRDEQHQWFAVNDALAERLVYAKT
jgi:TRAP-type mannitol/chloroaromatic compound transport system substrate-binding protein